MRRKLDVKIRNKVLRVVLVVGLVLLVGVFAQSTRNKAPTLLLGGQRIAVEIADDGNERERGLSYRAYLEEQSGMWFVYDDVANHGIWMKDMQFPIDIVWADEACRVVDIERYVQPVSYPRVYQPQTPAKYVLELNAGKVEQYGLKMGDVITPCRAL